MNPSEGELRRIRNERRKVKEKAENVFGGLQPETFSGEQLEALFNLYDQHFFDGQIRDRVAELSEEKGVPTKLDFYANERDSGYGGMSGVLYEKDLIVYFIDISPSILETIFLKNTGGLAYAAGEGCLNSLSCLLLIMEHEIVHLLMTLWGYDTDEKFEENPRIFGSHGLLFKCMLATYFGHTKIDHDLAIEGIEIQDIATKPRVLNMKQAYVNWTNSCYLDSVLMVMLANKFNFWLRGIFDSDISGIYQEAANKLRKEFADDYKVLTGEKKQEELYCINIRNILAEHDPTLKVGHRWIMQNPGNVYADIVTIFPHLAMDIPYRIFRSEMGEYESMKYRKEPALTMWDYIGQNENDEDFKEIMWDDVKSPVLVFTNGGVPRVTIFDETGDEDTTNIIGGEKYEQTVEKTRAFGPQIIHGRYTLVGAVTLQGVRKGKEGGAHYISYFWDRTIIGIVAMIFLVPNL